MRTPEARARRPFGCRVRRDWRSGGSGPAAPHNGPLGAGLTQLVAASATLVRSPCDNAGIPDRD